MFRALLVLVLAVSQIVAPQASRLAGFGNSIGDLGRSTQSYPEQPSSYAFAIWGVLFVLALLFAWRQFLPSQRNAALYQAVGPSAVVLFAASVAWMLTAQFRDNTFALLGLVWLMFFAATRGLLRGLAMRSGLDVFDRVITLPLFALYAGWLAVAVWLSTGSVLRSDFALLSVLGPSLQASMLLVLIGTTSLLLMRRSDGYLPLGLTTLWALAGVLHANHFVRQNTPVAVVVVALMLMVICYLLWQRRPAKKREF